MDNPQKLPRVLQRLTEIAMVLVVVATVVVLIGVAFTDGGLDVPLQFTPDADSYTITSDSWGPGTIVSAEGLAQFENRDTGLIVLFLTAVLIYTIPALALLILLRRFLRQVADGAPFVRENADALRWIGMIIIVFGLMAQGMQSFAAVVAMNTLTTEGLHIEANLSPDLTVVAIGLVLLVIAEAFRYGTQLQTDADLTV